MIPLKDDIPSYRKPYIMYLILFINVVVFLVELSLGRDIVLFIYAYGCIPSRIVHGEALYTLITSMFLHGDFWHIFGNMLFLYIFADNVEDAMGHIWFLIFYILSGLSGTFLHILFNWGSDIPSIGASGAISGVLGAYFVLYPRARILTLVPFGIFLRLMYLPAFVMLGMWFLMQLLFGLLSIPGNATGVAWFAHIGGFLFGILVGSLIKRRRFHYRII